MTGARLWYDRITLCRRCVWYFDIAELIKRNDIVIVWKSQRNTFSVESCLNVSIFCSTINVFISLLKSSHSKEYFVFMEGFNYFQFFYTKFVQVCEKKELFSTYQFKTRKLPDNFQTMVSLMNYGKKCDISYQTFFKLARIILTCPIFKSTQWC